MYTVRMQDASPCRVPQEKHKGPLPGARMHSLAWSEYRAKKNGIQRPGNSVMSGGGVGQGAWALPPCHPPGTK